YTSTLTTCSSGATQSLRSFPTRRSSDLAADDFVSTFTRWVRGVSGVAAGMQLALSPPFVLLTVLIGGSILITGGSMPAADLLPRSEEHTSELQSRENLVCRLLLEKKKRP